MEIHTRGGNTHECKRIPTWTLRFREMFDDGSICLIGCGRQRFWSVFTVSSTIYAMIIITIKRWEIKPDDRRLGLQRPAPARNAGTAKGACCV